MNWWIVFAVWLTDERRSLISSRDPCQRSSPSRISDTPRAGFKSAQNLGSRFDKWNCAVVITTTPWRQKYLICNAAFYYPVKASENCKVFWYFHAVEKGCIGSKWVNAIVAHQSTVSDLMILLSVEDKHLNVYTEEDIKRFQSLLSCDPDKEKSRKSAGISSIFEIRFAS